MDLEDYKSRLDDFITELRDLELTDSTISVYKTSLYKFRDYLIEKDIKTITKEIYIDYRDYLRNDLKFEVSNVNKYVVIINKYFIWAGYKDKLNIKILRKQEKHYLENVPSVSDYKRILRAAKKHDIIAYYFILIASYTGMRVSAICEIKIEDIIESRKNESYIKIFSKNKYNEVPFPAWLRRDILKYAKESKIKDGYLFPSPVNKGKPMTRKTMWKKVHTVTGYARVDLDKGHPHALRHLLGKEISGYISDNQTIADIFGHESLKTTARYQQKSKKEIAKIVSDFRFK